MKKLKDWPFAGLIVSKVTKLKRFLLVSAIGGLMLWLVAQSAGITPAQNKARIMLAEINQVEGKAFRDDYATRPGVNQLPAGLLVELIKEGQGPSPQEGDWVTVHYRGQFIDGRDFDNSWRRQQPATIPMSDAIEGWQRVIPSMQIGDRVRIVIPPKLAYGQRGSGAVGPEQTLIFEIELLDVLDEETALTGIVTESS